MRFIIFSTLCCIVFFSCSNQQNNPEFKGLEFSGTIENPKGSYALLRHGESVDSLFLDSLGSFSVSIALDTSLMGTFSHGGERSEIFVSAGKLHLNLNTEEFDESLRYSGDKELAASNNLLAGYYMVDEDLNMNHPAGERYLLAPMDYKSLMDSMKFVKNEFLENHGQDTNDAVLKLKKNETLYTWANRLLAYERGARYYQEIDEIEIPEEYNAFMDELSINDESLLEDRSYKGFVNAVLEKEVSERMSAMDSEEMNEMTQSEMKMKVILEKIDNPAVCSQIAFENMSETVRFEGLKDLSELKEIFLQACSDKSKISTIENKMAEWAPLYRGNPAPGFSYTSIDGKNVSLSDFEGKVVYVDVWATWCGPCKREIPHLQALEAEMHEEEVVFLSVSVDDDQDAWRTMVREDELGGTQVITGTGWQSEITDSYLINGIPRFLLIGKDGNIISADAPRPSSDKEIKDLIREALTGENAIAMIE